MNLMYSLLCDNLLGIMNFGDAFTPLCPEHDSVKMGRARLNDNGSSSSTTIVAVDSRGLIYSNSLV